MAPYVDLCGPYMPWLDRHSQCATPQRRHEDEHYLLTPSRHSEATFITMALHG